jgi:hypothetical protein
VAESVGDDLGNYEGGVEATVGGMRGSRQRRLVKFIENEVKIST